MKKLSEILNALNISKVKFYYTAIFGCFADIAKLIVEALTKLLKKTDPDKLKEYSVLAANIAKFIRYGIDLFVKNEKYKAAGIATAAAIEALAQHISNGEYTEDEFNADIDNIKAAIDAWVNVK